MASSAASAATTAAVQGFNSFIRRSALREVRRAPPAVITNWHITRGDTVVVLRGRDAGKSGKVKAVQRSKNRVIVEGVNMVRRASPTLGQPRPEMTL